MDGRVFNSFINRIKPFGFVIDQGKVIKGWEVGSALMRTGVKELLTIPPDLAYGDRGAGDIIPPNAPLLFEVVLVEGK